MTEGVVCLFWVPLLFEMATKGGLEMQYGSKGARDGVWVGTHSRRAGSFPGVLASGIATKHVKGKRA